MSDFTADLKPAGPQGTDILTAERRNSDIDVAQLSRHLLSREDFQSRQKRIAGILQECPLFSKRNNLDLSRPDRFHVGLARAKELRRLSRRYGWSTEDDRMAEYLLDEVSPFALSNTMFAASVRQQCNDEQRAYWLPKVENWEILGCYGQTELGHGSNVRGIETEARWNRSTKDFTIHSPSLTASKWWNGTLGRCANHAVVVAQLMLPGDDGQLKSFGPHQFIIQIRDLISHKPLEGVVIGDIGPKYGYSSMDNGYMLFKNFRVPRSALLAKYSSIDDDGNYIKPENPATVYGSMTYARAQIIMQARLVLARAVTIAVRYTLIRRQFSDRDSPPSAPEEAVLNYPTVQIRVLPLLATTYALHYTGEAMNNTYSSTRAQMERQNDFSKLAEMHASSSGLKSLCTTLAADGIETCRRALGGHGFGGGSGIISLNNDYLSKPTVEGDNYMITQQTASYLLKRMQMCLEKPAQELKDVVDAAFLEFLRNKDHVPGNNLLYDEKVLVSAFRYRASFLAHKAHQARVERKKPWKDMLIQLHKLSNAHCESILVSHFYDGVVNQTSRLGPVTDNVMRHLFRLFALFTLDKQSAEFMACGILKESHLEDLTTEIQNLMNSIRVHAARLVDAWDIPDYLLASSLGRFDGDVYTSLFKTAHEQNPLNMQTFNSDWKSEEIIKGEGEEHARDRIMALVSGSFGHEQKTGVSSRL